MNAVSKNRRMEKAATEALLRCVGYEQYFLLQDLTDEPRGTMSLPDFLLGSQTEEKLYIEVTHPFTDDQTAQILLNQGQHKDQPSHEENIEDFISAINKKIEDKCSKNYRVEGPVSLLIRSTSRISFLEEFREHKDKIVIPPDNKFKEILILFPRIKTRIFGDMPNIDLLPENEVLRVIYPVDLSNPKFKTVYYFPANAGDWTDLEVLQSSL